MLSQIKKYKRINGEKSLDPSSSGGQVSIEFTFCLIVILIMVYGIVKVFLWSGEDLVARQQAHTNRLNFAPTPRDQIEPYYYTPIKINAIWDGD